MTVWLLCPINETWNQEEVEKSGHCHNYATVIAHNFSGCDGQFLLKHYISYSVEPPKVTINGAKIITMQVKKYDSSIP